MSAGPGMRTRWPERLTAGLIAVGVVGGCVAALYLIGSRLVPQLPPWAQALAAIAGALLFLLSPFTAARLIRGTGARRPGDRE